MIADYFELCKPRVVLLMLLTALVGMCLATPKAVPLSIVFWGNLGIALVASSAAVLNHIADQHIDRLMQRTIRRPIAEGRISTKKSFIFATILCVLGMAILLYFINPLTAFLTFLSLIGYAVCYTLYLKHATPQNIVIGGIAGAVPPLLGWTAVTNSISPHALLLVLIIFVWTPPHFWALAIHRSDDYAEAKIPMLPNTHGIDFTRLNIVLYTVLLNAASILPYFAGMSGLIYLVLLLPANLLFLWYAWKLYTSRDKKWAMATFRYSIIYLGILFLLLLIDHYLG
ncbi:MAG: heme o synthase [Gammaproteobacteria bacterium]|nr:heme o synthase [Gammaproteobacteria bacterium]